MYGMAAAAFAGSGAVSVVRPDPRTGRLVRAVLSAEKPAAAGRAARVPSARLVETVDRIAQQNQLSPRLVHSVIQVESDYDPHAVSPKGAQGLMQLIPATARRFGVSDALDPADNIQGGARYLKYLLGLYQGDEALALAAYNAGEAAVARYNGVPPYPETRDYVAKVQRRLGTSGPRTETAGSVPAVQSDEAQTPEAGAVAAYNAIREVRDARGKITYISH